MRFKDIPQMTKTSGYRINVEWTYLEKWLSDMTEDLGLDLDPDFQRAHVWDEHKQRRYVEFILRGGQSAKDIYFNCKGWTRDFEGPAVLVDGKQRMEAVRKFLRNELYIFGGHFCEDFTDRLPRDAEFIIHVNDLETRPEVLQWYLDMNDGGVAHTESELAVVREMLFEEKYALSPEAKEARKPPPPDRLVGALHDPVHKTTGSARKGRSVRIKK